MAIHRSVLKRDRESLKRQTRNRYWKSRVRTASRKVTEAVGQKDKTTALAALTLAMKEIGKAKVKGVIHKNTACRKVSRLSTLVSSLS